MEYIAPYNSFDKPQVINDTNKVSVPTFMYNEKHKCLMVGDYYIFLEEKKMLKKGDEELNELFGIDFSKLIPDTPSEWIHLGVDGVSGIIDVIPGGQVISPIIDLVHAISYFIEAEYTDSEDEKKGLYIGGVLTGMFAFAPAIGNFGGAAVKQIISKVSKTGGGNIIKKVFSVVTGTEILKPLFRMLLKVKSFKVLLSKQLVKAEDTWLFKMLYKLDFIKQCVNYVKKDLDKVLISLGKTIDKDLSLFTKSVLHNSETAIKNSYKNMDKAFKGIVSEQQFISLNKNVIGKKIGVDDLDVSKEFFERNLNSYQNVISSIIDQNKTSITKAIVKSQSKASRIIEITGKQQFKKQYLKNINTFISKEFSESGIKAIDKIPYKEILKATIKKSTTKRVATKTGSKIASQAIKNPQTGGEEKEKEESKLDSDEITSSTSTDRASKRPEQDSSEDDINKEKNDQLEKFKTKNNLKTASVKTLSDMGNTKLFFEAPNRKGEDGKVMLEGGIFNKTNLSESLSLYEEPENLLRDIKLAKGKDNKKRVRKGEMKKWEKTKTISTPVVESHKARYNFHFLVRERWRISLATTEDIDTIDWLRVISDVNNGINTVKYNNSIYLIIEKVMLE